MQNVKRSLILFIILGINGLLAVSALAATTYTGKGYFLILDGSGLSASYIGCNSVKKWLCLYLVSASHYSKGHYTWKSNGYAYKLSPMRQSQRQLQVFNPQGKRILNRVMNPKKHGYTYNIFPLGRNEYRLTVYNYQGEMIVNTVLTGFE